MILNVRLHRQQKSDEDSSFFLAWLCSAQLPWGPSVCLVCFRGVVIGRSLEAHPGYGTAFHGVDVLISHLCLKMHISSKQKPDGDAGNQFTRKN